MTPGQYKLLEFFNKTATSILLSLAVLFALYKAIDILYPTGAAPKPPVAASTPAVQPAPAAPEKAAAAPSAAAQAAAQAERDALPFETLLATADVKAGQTAAKVCTTCHNFAKGAGAKIGPDLYGVVGREIAKEPGFSYSASLQGKGGTWTFKKLNEWIAAPNAFAPGTKMAFAGVKSASQRANIIAYLDQQSDQPVPLPKK